MSALGRKADIALLRYTGAIPDRPQRMAMRRREITTLIGGAVSWPLAAREQQVRLIGVLFEHAESNSDARSWLGAFRAELARLGWKEGGNLRIETRWSAGNTETMRTSAKELVDLRPDAILGRGTSETIALARETRTIPIAFAAVSHPFGRGFAAMLSRPGGNNCRVTNVGSALGGHCGALA